MYTGKTVLLGITGGIAAYKMAYVASGLMKENANVEVMMTENACEFISPMTFEALTKNKCHTSLFDGEDGGRHNDLDIRIHPRAVKIMVKE